MDHWWQNVTVWLVLLGVATLFCSVIAMITLHKAEKKLFANAAWLFATFWTMLLISSGHSNTSGIARALIVAAVSTALRALLPSFWHDLNRDHSPEKEKVPETPSVRH